MNDMIPGYHEGGNIPIHEHGEGEGQHLASNLNPGPPWGRSIHSLRMTGQPLMADTLYTSPEGVEGFLADEALALRAGPTMADRIAEERAMTEGLTGPDYARARRDRAFARMREVMGGDRPPEGERAYTPSHYEHEDRIRDYIARRRLGPMGDPTIGRASGGIIGLRGGGQVPMVLVNGEYIPAYGAGALFKKLLPLAPLVIPGIGPLAAGGIGALTAALSKKLEGGGVGDALTSGVKAGVLSYAGKRGIEALKKGWGASDQGFFGKLEGALGGLKGEFSAKDLMTLGPMLMAAEAQEASSGLGQPGLGGGRIMPGAGSVGGRGTVPGQTITQTYGPRGREFGLFDNPLAKPGQQPLGNMYANRRFGGLIPGYQRGGGLGYTSPGSVGELSPFDWGLDEENAFEGPKVTSKKKAPTKKRGTVPDQTITQTYGPKGARQAESDRRVREEFYEDLSGALPGTMSGYSPPGRVGSGVTRSPTDRSEIPIGLGYTSPGGVSGGSGYTLPPGVERRNPLLGPSDPGGPEDDEFVGYQTGGGSFDPTTGRYGPPVQPPVDRNEGQGIPMDVESDEVIQATGGPPIFEGSGYNPFSMPTTAAQFTEAGDSRAAAMLNRMNKAPVVESYIPEPVSLPAPAPTPTPVVGRQEGGIVGEREEPYAPVDRNEGQGIPMDVESDEVVQELMVAIMNPDDPESVETIVRLEKELGKERLAALLQQLMMAAQAPDEVATAPMQAGGLVPGDGDGMADNIVVTADEGTPNAQDIAIGSGEYVMAADVVSGLGSGNTDRGAEVLDQLQQDVRLERTGSPQQPPPIDLSDVLPETYSERYA